MVIKTITSILVLSLTVTTFLSGSDERTKHPVVFKNSMKVALQEQKNKVYHRFNGATRNYEISQQFYLEKAQYHREEANKALLLCEKYVDFIPDIDLRQQMQTFITSFVGSFPVVDIKTKFLIVSFAMIADLTNQIVFGMYDNYTQFKIHAQQAVIEMETYLDYLSMMIGCQLYWNPSLDLDTYVSKISPHLEEAIQYLIIVEMHIATMVRPLDCDLLSAEINYFRYLICCQCRSGVRLTYKHSNKLKKIIEKSKEIFEKCCPEDRLIESELYRLMALAYEDILLVENELGIK